MAVLMPEFPHLDRSEEGLGQMLAKLLKVSASPFSYPQRKETPNLMGWLG